MSVEPAAPAAAADGVQELPVQALDVLRRRRSAKWHSYPPDVLPLTLAEMDYALAPAIRAALHEAVERSDTGYPVPAPELGEALAAFACARWAWQLDPAQVTAVADVGVGIVELLRVLVHDGGKVIVNTPVYSPFFTWIEEAGAQAVQVPLARDAHGWHLDLPAMERAFAAGADVHLLCSPHNPVGRVHGRDELTALVELARRYDVVLLSDEIHAPLVFADATFTPLLDLPRAAQVALALHSASKTFNLAGLKCAAVVTGSSRMSQLVDRLPADTPWRVGHLGVLASLAAYTDGQGWLDQLLLTLHRRREQLGRLLAQHLPDVTWQPPQASYPAWLNCTALGDGAVPQERFLRDSKVALEPGPKFGPQGGGYVRLNFATSATVLEQAIRAMAGSGTTA